MTFPCKVKKKKAILENFISRHKLKLSQSKKYNFLLKKNFLRVKR